MTINLSYPIGDFQRPDRRDQAMIKELIDAIEDLPAALFKAVEGLSQEQLDTPYRPGGWTVRQVIHHMADSHMNAFIRFKLALTEEHPEIKPYFEDRWAKLPDTATAPIQLSLAILQPLHQRWTLLLRSLNQSDYLKTYFHPEAKKSWELFDVLALYAWHGRHHTAHITELKKRNNW